MYKTLALLAALIALSNGSSSKSLRVKSYLQQQEGSANDHLPKDKFAFDANSKEGSQKAPKPGFGEDKQSDSKPERPAQEPELEHGGFNGTDFNRTDFNRTEFGNGDNDRTAFIDSDFGNGDFDGADFDGADFDGADFDGIDFDGTDFDGADFNNTDFNSTDFNSTEFDEDYEWVDPKLPSEYYTYEDLLDEIIDSSEDVVDTAADLQRLQDRLVSSIDDIRLELISVALDDDEAALYVLSDIEECVEDEEVYDDSDDSKIWGIVNSCWNIRPEEFAANLLAYNTYWVLYAVDACHGVDVEYKEVIGTFYQNPEDEFQQAVEHEVEEGTDNTVLLSLKEFATSKISKISLLQQAPREERDEDDIVNELETLYSDIVEEIYRSCYEAYELRNELRDNLYEAYYPAYHLPYPDEEPTDEVLEAYGEALSE